MSNHFTGLSLGPPLGDQRLDLCDLYAFQSPADSARTVLILNANPNADALHPDAIYRLAIDNDGDLQNDIAFSYVFSTPQDGRQTVDVYLAHGDEAKEPEAVGEKIFDAVEVSFGKTPDIHQSGQLHVLRGCAQRCVLLRLRRHQESVRHLGDAELHRHPTLRNSAGNRRGRARIPTPTANVFSTVLELPTKYLGARSRHPHLGPLQSAPGRQARPRRPRRPPLGEQLLQHRRHQAGVQRQ